MGVNLRDKFFIVNNNIMPTIAILHKRIKMIKPTLSHPNFQRTGVNNAETKNSIEPRSILRKTSLSLSAVMSA